MSLRKWVIASNIGLHFGSWLRGALPGWMLPRPVLPTAYYPSGPLVDAPSPPFRPGKGSGARRGCWAGGRDSRSACSAKARETVSQPDACSLTGRALGLLQQSIIPSCRPPNPTNPRASPWPHHTPAQPQRSVRWVGPPRAFADPSQASLAPAAISGRNSASASRVARQARRLNRASWVQAACRRGSEA